MTDLRRRLHAAKITGTGSAFPKTRVSNDDLSRLVETSHEWIVERTGIHERRKAIPGDESEQNSSIAFIAATRALEMAGKRATDIDQIVFATCTPDTIVPSAGCWLQQKLGATQAWAVDLNAACSGFVYALSVADSFIKTGQVKTALVVGSETLSSITNFKDRGSCIIFGDGGGAVVVEQAPVDSPSQILSYHLGSDGSLWDLFQIPAGGSNMEVTPQVYEKNLHKMQMKGREIFKVAVRTLADYAISALQENNLTIDDLDWLIPHQANLRIIEAVAKRLNFPMEKVLVNIQNFGNTSSATVPTALDEAVRAGKIKKGETILMDVFGAGLTYGSLLLRW